MDVLDNEIDPRLIPSLTDEQESILAILYVVSGLLSMFGSCIIVTRVLRNRKQSKSYDRIMLGLSCSDIVASLSYIATPFLLPSETSTRVTAIGNEVSCSVLGWLTQVGYAAIPYNAVLSFYMLAVIRFSVTPGDFAARFEPYLHVLTVFYFLATATIGMPFHIFTELRLGLGCWVAEYPSGCNKTGDCLNVLIGWLFVGVPLLGTFASLVVNNIVIAAYVKRVLLVPGLGRTKAQQVQIRRVATQGFLYVGAFFISYVPVFIVRILGSNGHRLSTEADIYGILILQSSLLPLQGFFNMTIYTRPLYLRFRQAGASRWMSIRGACFTADIPPKSISEANAEAMPSVAPAGVQSKKESSPDNISPVDDGPLNHGGIEESGSNTDVLEVSSDGLTDQDHDSGSSEMEDEIVLNKPPSNTQRPSKSCLKPSSMHMHMDGSVTYS